MAALQRCHPPRRAVPRRGAALVLRPRELASAPEFLAWCRGRGITVLNLPTAYWHTLVADAGKDRPWPEAVRLVIIRGEEARAAALRGWQQWVGEGVRLVNTYGPTEATIVATRWWPENGTEQLARVPIGRPVAGARALVLDRHLEPVAAGVPGELFLGGDGVARGYLARPTLTARRFVPDPFGPTGARLYATGDRARWREDGQLEFLGRLDHQVKVRGFRIEIGEIEAVLTAHPQVREAAVVAVGGGPGSGDPAVRLVAHVVGEAASDPLRDFLAQRLPEYMVPAAFLPLEALPLTPGGKVDQAALAGRALTPEQEQDAAEATSVRPRNETEQMLAEIFAELLGCKGISVFDSFFELGGHSLLATRLATRVRDVFAVELPLREIFQAPTVSPPGGDHRGARHRPARRAERRGGGAASRRDLRGGISDQPLSVGRAC